MSADVAPVQSHRHGHDPHEDIVYPEAIPFALVHLACLGVLWTGVTMSAVLIAVALYVIRMWAITAGFHRYFSHRSYKTSRAFQFLLAFLGQTSAQRGVIWWAAVHRHHHRHSDTPEDVHSPSQFGLFFAHVGWIFAPPKREADYSKVQDLTDYPELVWLDDHPYLPAALLALLVFLVAGWPGLIVGFFMSTVAVYHGSFIINSLAHTFGRQRYVTGDHSRNSLILALITMGEGWHNNHHHYQSSTRQGFFWWEIDVSYYVLKAMSWVGLVWDLREPPEEVVLNERRLGRKVVEKVAHELAHTFNLERISAQAREAWAGTPGLEELRARLDEARSRAEARIADLNLPNIPTLDELRARAEERFADAPSMDAIAARAREIIIETVEREIYGERGPQPA